MCNGTGHQHSGIGALGVEKNELTTVTGMHKLRVFCWHQLRIDVLLNLTVDDLVSKFTSS